jgi:NAD dependent epimerase/dehydratase family.
MRILVTGGAGYIGSVTAHHLLTLGAPNGTPLNGMLLPAKAAAQVMVPVADHLFRNTHGNHIATAR